MSQPWQPIGQKTADPVGAYYKGKALRADTALREKQAEALQMEIDSAPAAAAAAARKEGRLQQKADIEAAEFNVKMTKDIATVSSRAYEAVIDGGGSVEEATRKADDVVKSMTADYTGADPQKISDAYDRGPAYDYALNKAIADEDGANRRTLSLAESMALPGMTEGRAKNSVIQVDEDGQIYIDDAPTGMTDVDLEARGGVNASGVSKNTIDFQENVIGAVGAVQTGTELMVSSVANPEALGVPGGMMRFGGNLVSGAKAIADWAGYEKLSPEDTEKQEIGASAFTYNSVDTDKLGVSGAEAEKFRAGVYGIAFAAAVAEQGIRPTDKDIQQFIDQIGGRATSARAFRETIAQFMRRQDRRLKTIADVKQIGEADRAAAFASWKPAYRSFMEAYAKATGRKTASNDAGDRMIELGPGNWESF